LSGEPDAHERLGLVGGGPWRASAASAAARTYQAVALMREFRRLLLERIEV